MRSVALGLLLASTTAGAAKTPPLASGPWGSRQPVAPAAAIVESGKARFTVLTDRLLRLEYSDSDSPSFEDRATVAFINRKLDVPDFTHSLSDDGKTLRISTAALELSYTVGAAFSAESLSVTSLDDDSAFDSWHFGKANPGNLLGTIRTLDGEDLPPLNCNLVQTQLNNSCGWDESDCQCEWGLVSRDGWTVVDDTENYALDDDNDWWAGQNTDTVDQYLFAHGHDYRAALKDFIAIAGSIALTPRQALGVWWTRWYDYTQDEVLDIVEDFRDRAMPLDIMVLDMNWHTKDDWTGYTFDDRLYPYPEDMLQALDDEGVLTAANLHDANGINSWEAQYEAMCEAVGQDASAKEPVPYNVSDRTSQIALEDVVLKAVEDQGMDFWWIDWQQGEAGYGAAGNKQNPTIWTAHMRSTDRQRRGEAERAMVLARWGGLGGHRYQVGFSGDVKDVNWRTLAYQPYFTSTAANVGFGAWSHDIVGPGDDLELYTRWFQWGAYSGVLRNHDRGGSAGECADQSQGCWVDMPWLTPNDNFVAMRKAMREREALLPYLYTATRTAFDEGVSVLHPLYYDFPEEIAAYGTGLGMPEYFLGPDLIIEPVVVQGDNGTKLASQPLWVPPGNWIDRSTGVLRSGVAKAGDAGKNRKAAKAGTCAASSDLSKVDCSPPFDEQGCLAMGCCWDASNNISGAPHCYMADDVSSTFISRVSDLDDVPTLVRAGAVLPTLPLADGDSDLIGVAARQYASLAFEIHSLGAKEGTGQVYEDDGATIAYATGSGLDDSFAWTTASWKYENSNGSSLKLTVATEGTFPELPSSRDYTFNLPNAPPALSAAVTAGRIRGHTVSQKEPMKAVKSSTGRKTRMGKMEEAVTMSYDGHTLTLSLAVKDVDVTQPLAITIDLACPTMNGESQCGAESFLSGAQGVFMRAASAKSSLDEARMCPGESDTDTGALQRLASTPAALTHEASANPDAFWTRLQSLPTALEAAVTEIKAMTVEHAENEWRQTRALALLQAAADDM